MQFTPSRSNNPSKENLTRRGVDLGCKLCVLCREKEGSTTFFFCCKIANNVWEQCDKWVGMISVHHKKPQLHFQPFHLIELNGKQKHNIEYYVDNNYLSYMES